MRAGASMTGQMEVARVVYVVRVWAMVDVGMVMSMDEGK
jgi:hypothetical protein